MCITVNVHISFLAATGTKITSVSDVNFNHDVALEAACDHEANRSWHSTLVHDWVLMLKQECIRLVAEHAGRRLRRSMLERDWLPEPSHRAHYQRSTCGEQADDRRSIRKIAPSVSAALSLAYFTTQQSRCTLNI